MLEWNFFPDSTVKCGYSTAMEYFYCWVRHMRFLDIWPVLPGRFSVWLWWILPCEFWILLGSACCLRKRAGHTRARTAGESVWMEVPANTQLDKASQMSRAAEASCLALREAGGWKGVPVEFSRTRYSKCAMLNAP